MGRIVDQMFELRYPSNKTGVCRGLELMAERARRAGQYDRFQRRMDYLAGLKEGELANRLGVLKKANKKPVIFTPEEQVLFDKMKPIDKEILPEIEPFFFQVLMHYSPQAIRVFLEKSGPNISQSDFRKVEELMFEDKPLPSPRSFYINESPENRESYIAKFLAEIQQSEEPCGLLIGSPDHAIHLFYDAQQRTWFLTDHSQLTPYTSFDKLKNDLVRIFTTENNKVAHLSFDVFTEVPQKQNTTSLLTKLKAISDDSIGAVSTSARLYQTDYMGESPLMFAINQGLLEAVEALLAQPDIDVNRLENGQSPLFMAAQSGNINIVMALLKHKKIKVNEPNSKGFNPLYVAIEMGHADVVKALLENNARVPMNVRSPFVVAIERARVEVVDFLLDYPDIAKDIKPLPIAAGHGNVDFIKSLLEKRPSINVNDTDSSGETPLFAAAKRGSLNVVKFLLSRPGIEINKANRAGDTPILIALRVGYTKVVEALLEWPDFKVSQDHMDKLLLEAIKGGHVGIFKSLLSKTDQNYNTSLILSAAVNKNQSEILGVLFEKSNVTLLNLMKNPKIPDMDQLENLKQLKSSWYVAIRKEQVYTAGRNSSTPLITSICEYLDKKGLNPKATADRCKMAFFLEVVGLKANKNLTADTLLHTLSKFEGTQLFYKTESFHSKATTNSKTAKLVASLFTELGSPITPQQLKDIVDGKTSQIKLQSTQSNATLGAQKHPMRLEDSSKAVPDSTDTPRA